MRITIAHRLLPDSRSMLALVVRTLGYAALAAAMVVGVLDGARSIADGATQLSTLAASLEGLFPRAYPAFGEAVARLAHPKIWDPVLKTILQAPATPALFLLGLVLLLAGRRGQEAILPPE